MPEFVRLGRVAAGICFIAIAAGGCSTVMRSEDAVALRAGHAERAALIEAAAAVARANWPTSDDGGWGGQVFAGQARAASAAKAAEFYLSTLAAPDRKNIVLADAATHLRAADALADATLSAAESLRPTMADVTVVETAIGDLRAARNIYLESLKALSREQKIDAGEIRGLKIAFNEAIEAVGEAADVLAERVEAERSRAFAGSALATGSM